MNRNARALNLLILAAVNLLLIFLVCAMFRLPSGGGFYQQLYFRAMVSLTTVVPATVMLVLACYGALGESHLASRMILMAAGTGLVFAAMICGGALIPGVTLGDFPGNLAFWLGPAVCLFVALLPFRQLFGWRIVWLPCDSPFDTPPNFRVLHLWAWTAAIAVPLGMAQTIYGMETGVHLFMALKEFAGTLFVLVPCLWLAGTTRSRRLWAPAIIGLAALFAVCASAFYLAIYFAMKGPPLAWFQYVLWIEQPLLYNLAAATVLLGNLLWLEALGLRFVRPKAAIRMPPKSA